MTIVLEKNDYVEPSFAREEVVQLIVDAFIQKMKDMEVDWRYAEQQCLCYDRDDNGVYVYHSINGKPLISTMSGKGHIRVTNDEMDIAYECLKRGGYYYYSQYNITRGEYKDWWYKKPSFFGKTPIENAKFSPFIN